MSDYLVLGQDQLELVSYSGLPLVKFYPGRPVSFTIHDLSAHLRYSLRTFVVVLTVFCVWLGLLVYRVNKQRDAVQWVKDQGGLVVYDFEWEIGKGAIDDPEPPGPDWLGDLIGIDYFADVVFVDFNSTEVRDLGPLRDLTQLVQLDLIDTPVSDLQPLRELIQLQRLRLSGTRVFNVAPLCDLTALDVLDLTGTPVTTIAPLRELSELKGLWLAGTQVSNLQPLRGFISLESLGLGGTQLADLSPLIEMKSRSIWTSTMCSGSIRCWICQPLYLWPPKCFRPIRRNTCPLLP